MFSKSFMEHLDRQSKVTKATVGQGDGHVRRQLFRLNRTVCLKYPEYGVPWFHEKYCLEMQRHWVAPTAVAPVIDDIYQHLCKAAGGREYVGVDVCSPYFFSLGNRTCDLPNLSHTLSFPFLLQTLKCISIKTLEISFPSQQNPFSPKVRTLWT